LQYDNGSQAGILHLYRSRDKWEEAKQELAMLQRTFGAQIKPHAVWDAEQCYAQEPALTNSRASIAGGIWWEDNESGDCNMFTSRLADVCRSKYGVTFLYDTGVSLLLHDSDNPRHVRSLLTDEGREIEVDRVVVCLGSYTAPLLRRSLGLWLPIFPVKGYSLTLHPGGTTSSPSSSGASAESAPLLNIADIESKTYIARLQGSLGDRLRVVGMGELCGHDQTIDPASEGLANLTTVVGQLFPPLHASIAHDASTWACLRPMTPYVCHARLRTSVGDTSHSQLCRRQGFGANHRAGGAHGERLCQLGTWEHGLDAGLRFRQACGCTRRRLIRRHRSYTLLPGALRVMHTRARAHKRTKEK
jgi:D-amino-acid dehydrogenase